MDAMYLNDVISTRVVSHIAKDNPQPAQIIISLVSFTTTVLNCICLGGVAHTRNLPPPPPKKAQKTTTAFSLRGL